MNYLRLLTPLFCFSIGCANNNSFSVDEMAEYQDTIEDSIEGESDEFDDESGIDFEPELLISATNPGAKRIVLDQAIYPNARCNDGTAPVMYFSEAADPNSNKWLIHLEAGGGCHDVVGCEDRWQNEDHKMGSGCFGPGDCDNSYGVAGGTLPPRKSFGGLLKEHPQNYFIDYHRVFVEYCTSDSWSGSGGTLAVNNFPNVDSPGMVEFNGHHVVMAVLDRLSNRKVGEPELDDPGVTLLFSGSSAGSAGAKRNLDRVAAVLPDAADVRGLFDAGFNGKTYPGPNNDTCSSRLAMGQVRTAPTATQLLKWNTHRPQLDESCMASAIQNGQDPALCLSLGYVMENDHIQTPFMIYQAQKDYIAQRGLSDALLLYIGRDPTRQADRNKCLIEQVRSFGAAAVASSSALEGWYAPCNIVHVSVYRKMANRDHITRNGVGYSLHDAVSNWFEGAGPTRFVAPNCQ